MEDVVLHYQPRPPDGLSSLLERTENLLEPFPCRTPPAFAPWFPTVVAAADRRLPIRPAKPAPVLTSSGDVLGSASRSTAGTNPHPENEEKGRHDDLIAEKHCGHPRDETPPGNPQKNKDTVVVSETSDHCASVPLTAREVTGLSPETGSPVRRSWSVFAPRAVLLPSCQALSKQFHHAVSNHRLHLRQRARWVIGGHNCGATRDIEQVWRTLSRSIQNSRLPTCNANLQRERAEIWVFCDVLYSEQVGRSLKDELQLSGRISLSVHRLENIFSM